MNWKTTAPWCVALAFAFGSLGLLAGKVEILGVLFGVGLLFYGAIQADRVGEFGRTSRSIILASVASAALVASVALFQWPLRAAYSLSRPALDRLADEVRHGRAPTVPVWAGLFRISETEISYNGIPCLWAGRYSKNRVGFAHCGPQKLPLCPWTHVVLDQRWQYLVED